MGFDLTIPPQLQRAAAREDLAVCNETTAKHGLRLTEPQMMELVERRGEALRATGRVEFGRGVVRELVRGFCDSPYLSQENYAEVIADVQDVFYRRKEDAEAAGRARSPTTTWWKHCATRSMVRRRDRWSCWWRCSGRNAAGARDAWSGGSVRREDAERGTRGGRSPMTRAEERVRDEFRAACLDDGAVGSAPGNEYADGFYDGYHETATASGSTPTAASGDRPSADGTGGRRGAPGCRRARDAGATREAGERTQGLGPMAAAGGEPAHAASSVGYVQLALWQVLAEQVALYTMGESSSLPEYRRPSAACLRMLRAGR